MFAALGGLYVDEAPGSVSEDYCIAVSRSREQIMYITFSEQRLMPSSPELLTHVCCRDVLNTEVRLYSTDDAATALDRARTRSWCTATTFL